MEDCLAVIGRFGILDGLDGLAVLEAIKNLTEAPGRGIDVVLRCFKPRFNTPLPDRAWKFEFRLGDLAGEQRRAARFTLCQIKGASD